MQVQVVVPDWIDRARGYPALMAFIEGLHRLGVPFYTTELRDARPFDGTMVCWGVEKTRIPARRPFGELQRQQRQCGELLIVERGFILRDHYYVVVRDDLNGRGTFPHTLNSTPWDRWELLRAQGVVLKDWGHSPPHGKVIVIGQVPWDTSCQHVDHTQWVAETVRRARDAFQGHPVVFRPHPIQPSAVAVEGVIYDLRQMPLEDVLAEGVHCVVTFSSTSGVDALLAGVPVVAYDRTSMVYDVASHSVEEPLEYPVRGRWAHWIAYCQWTFEEMRLGLPWKHFHPE